MSRLRYYKDDKSFFKLDFAVIESDKASFKECEYYNNEMQFSSIKDAISFVVSNKCIMDWLKSQSNNTHLLITMIRDDTYQYNNTLCDCILKYCKDAIFCFNKDIKPINAMLEFYGVSENSGFNSAVINFKEGKVYYGDGTALASARVFFETECENRELAEYILSHTDDILY